MYKSTKGAVAQLLTVLFLLFTSNVFCFKDVVQPKEEKVTTTTEVLKPWVRTITQPTRTFNEVVTPTVIAGVTFSTKPPVSTDPLQPWVSLNKLGEPKTIRPQIKNGRTKNASPTYSTYFGNVYTTTRSYEELGKPHNMDPNDVHEEEIYEDEDKTYVSLNPIIRCIPPRYFNKGLGKNIDSAPFCTPRENSELKVDHTYFVTWYTRFFTTPNEEDPLRDDQVQKVRIHLSYVHESAHEKGVKKRANEFHEATFFVSEWLKNVDGVYPLTIDKEWLQGEYERKVLMSIQPESISDEDFHPLMEEVNPLTFRIILGSRVFKTSKNAIDLEHASNKHKPIWYIIMGTPCIVAVAVFGMYIFIKVNSRYRDFSDVKNAVLQKRHRVIGKVKDMKKFQHMKNHKYDELPMYHLNKKKGKGN
ncbi:hypothetical protein ACO0QE_002062 [Hanseniaspora vineae]